METMETNIKDQVSDNIFKIPAIAASGMIVFFILMKLIGMATVVEFRFLNFIIMFIGIRYALLSMRILNNGKLEYLSGMLRGFLTSLLTSLFFAAFLFIYLSFDYNFMGFLKETQAFGHYLSPASSALVTVIEGVAGGSIISYAMMHLYNRDSNPG